MTPQHQILVGGMDGWMWRARSQVNGFIQQQQKYSTNLASHNVIIIRFRVDSHGCMVPGCWMMSADVVTHDVNDELKQLIRVYVGQQLIMQP